MMTLCPNSIRVVNAYCGNPSSISDKPNSNVSIIRPFFRHHQNTARKTYDYGGVDKLFAPFDKAVGHPANAHAPTIPENSPRARNTEPISTMYQPRVINPHEMTVSASTKAMIITRSAMEKSTDVSCIDKNCSRLRQSFSYTGDFCGVRLTRCAYHMV